MEADHKTATFRQSLHGLPYHETVAAQQPTLVTSSSSMQLAPSPTRTEQDAGSPSTSQAIQTHSHEALPTKSPLSNPSAIDSPTTASPTTSVPKIRVGEEEARPSTSKKWLSLKSSKTPAAEQMPAPFAGLSLDIPSGDFGDDLAEDHMRFTKRGSLLVDGRNVSPSRVKSSGLEQIVDDKEKTNGQTSPLEAAQLRSTLQHTPSVKVMSTDDEVLSDKVRSYYAFGTEAPHDNDGASSMANRMGLRWQDALGGTNTDASSVASLSRGTSATDIHSEIASQPNGSRVSSIQKEYPREDTELAGGIEDWNEVDNADVDRYGFIIPKPETKNSGLTRSPTTKQLTRVSTSLQLASEAPRRKHTLRRTPSNARSVRSSSGPLPSSTSMKSLKRPPSAHSAQTTVNRHNTFRSRDRKLMDDASDMLTLPRSASNLSTDPHASAADDPRARRKEVEREEKWRKMARPTTSNGIISHKTMGGGMAFTFDTTSTKLIDRTWKGIPDKWRSTAWHAFLSASAARHHSSLTDENLTTSFTDYQLSPSADDVQIDIDVPRTINSHIMFRRRYRGGQRLLFRVLHAMSLHFPDTGYVQGMAALAATLLSYYSEEMAFVMLVRLWELRGLEKLYKNGFGGLMAALDDFETKWLGKGEVGRKLEEVGIPPTSYGTRWYLTLFNYSVPFPAQLRVWDVFMLLGDDTSHPGPTPSKPTVVANQNGTSHGADGKANGDVKNNDNGEDTRFGTTLDVLHATSAALIDGMRDILLESDFENAMKVLTSWVPIKDEDVFMRVARAEWKVQREKSGGS